MKALILIASLVTVTHATHGVTFRDSLEIKQALKPSPEVLKEIERVEIRKKVEKATDEYKKKFDELLKKYNIN